MDNTKELYILLDQILLNLFDLLEVLRKNPTEIEEERETRKQEIHRLIKDVIQMVEHSLEDLVFSESFLDRDSKTFTHFGTFSYMMTEFRLKD